MLIDYLEAFDIDNEMFSKLNSCKGLAGLSSILQCRSEQEEEKLK
jgi:hypothetical protein